MHDEHLNAIIPGANNRPSYGILKSGVDNNGVSITTNSLEISMENIRNNTSTTDPSTGIILLYFNF